MGSLLHHQLPRTSHPQGLLRGFLPDPAGQAWQREVPAGDRTGAGGPAPGAPRLRGPEDAAAAGPGRRPRRRAGQVPGGRKGRGGRERRGWEGRGRARQKDERGPGSRRTRMAPQPEEAVGLCGAGICGQLPPPGPSPSGAGTARRCRGPSGQRGQEAGGRQSRAQSAAQTRALARAQAPSRPGARARICTAPPSPPPPQPLPVPSARAPVLRTRSLRSARTRSTARGPQPALAGFYPRRRPARSSAPPTQPAPRPLARGSGTGLGPGFPAPGRVSGSGCLGVVLPRKPSNNRRVSTVSHGGSPR